VERVAFLTKGGALKAGFLVETWSNRSSVLHHTLVDGTGKDLTDLTIRKIDQWRKQSNMEPLPRAIRETYAP
jgi:hypothetical protein